MWAKKTLNEKKQIKAQIYFHIKCQRSKKNLIKFFEIILKNCKIFFNEDLKSQIIVQYPQNILIRS